MFTGHTEDVYTATLTVTDANALQAMDAAEITVQVPTEWDLFDEELSGSSVFSSCQVLTAEQTTVLGDGDVVLWAPVVVLANGFTVESGGTLTILGGAPPSCP